VTDGRNEGDHILDFELAARDERQTQSHQSSDSEGNPSARKMQRIFGTANRAPKATIADAVASVGPQIGSINSIVYSIPACH
jgi:hypothetical protein